MKSIKTIIICLLCIPISMQAEKKNDNVKISFSNKMAIEIKSQNINKFPVDSLFIKTNIQRFFKYCRSSNIEELMQQANQKFEIQRAEGYEPYQYESYDKDEAYELNISEREVPRQIISIHNFEENLYYLQKHELVFADMKNTYLIKFDSLPQLKTFIEQTYVKTIYDIVKEQNERRDPKIVYLHYAVDEGMNYRQLYRAPTQADDQIIISFGTGLQNIKDIWVANMEVALGLSFGRKGIRKNTFTLYHEWQYDFSNFNQRNINRFVDIGYRRDFSKDPEDSNAYTFKLGYLVDRQGSLYDNDTFRFAVGKSVGKHFMVEPQLYFTEFFKDVVPSFTVGFSF